MQLAEAKIHGSRVALWTPSASNSQVPQTLYRTERAIAAPRLDLLYENGWTRVKYANRQTPDAGRSTILVRSHTYSCCSVTTSDHTVYTLISDIRSVTRRGCRAYLRCKLK